MSPVLYAAAIIVPIAVAVIAAIAFFGQRHLGKHRGVTREEFIRAFAGSDVDSELAGAVFDYYKSQVRAKEFSVAPDDDYERVLLAGDEEIDDDAEALMKKLGLRRPPDYMTARSETRIRTIRDMVLWLNWVRTHQPGTPRS